MYAPHRSFAVSVAAVHATASANRHRDRARIGVDLRLKWHQAQRRHQDRSGGINFLVKVATAAERCWSTLLYEFKIRQEGWYLERTVHCVNRVPDKKKLLKTTKAARRALKTSTAPANLIRGLISRSR
jgi:hypothetical protein